MLKHLYIKNFALIDTLDIHFNRGLSVITGETGAGKSIILGAINLLLGQRADVKSIKQGAAKCVIEAHFDIKGYDIKDFFNRNELDLDESDCILRREISASGKSRAFINDTPVPLTVVKELGRQLIDIHSQHQNLLINEEGFQLNILDVIAKDNELLDSYKECFASYRTAQKALKNLQNELEESKRNEDFLRFQLEELSEFALEPGMQDNLEMESEKLTHVEDIKTALYSVSSAFDDESGEGVLEKLKQASSSLAEIVPIYPEAKDVSERIEGCYIELKDISRELSGEMGNIEFDPERLEEINGKLDKIYALEQKHHVNTVAELIEIKENISEQLSHIEGGDEELKALEAEEQKQLVECEKLAAQLSKCRASAAKQVEAEMQSRLVMLGMPKVRFSVNIENKELGSFGHDRVSFLFSANTNTPMMPVAQTASGGEIARVMLSLKAMISGASNLPTIIFDEIDTGVSGKIAEKMGEIMKEMADSNRQVISITHLPQIAAKGSTHYKVFKEETPEGTASRMVCLGDKERVYEIAQMLSGSDVSDAAISNAKELLKQTLK